MGDLSSQIGVIVTLIISFAIRVKVKRVVKQWFILIIKTLLLGTEQIYKKIIFFIKLKKEFFDQSNVEINICKWRRGTVKFNLISGELIEIEYSR